MLKRVGRFLWNQVAISEKRVRLIILFLGLTLMLFCFFMMYIAYSSIKILSEDWWYSHFTRESVSFSRVNIPVEMFRDEDVETILHAEVVYPLLFEEEIQKNLEIDDGTFIPCLIVNNESNLPITDLKIIYSFNAPGLTFYYDSDYEHTIQYEHFINEGRAMSYNFGQLASPTISLLKLPDRVFMTNEIYDAFMLYVKLNTETGVSLTQEERNKVKFIFENQNYLNEGNYDLSRSISFDKYTELAAKFEQIQTQLLDKEHRFLRACHIYYWGNNRTRRWQMDQVYALQPYKSVIVPLSCPGSYRDVSLYPIQAKIRTGSRRYDQWVINTVHIGSIDEVNR